MELLSEQSQNIDQSPSQTLPPQPISSSPKPKSKLSLFLLLGIIIFGLISGIYFLLAGKGLLSPQPTPTPTQLLLTTPTTTSNINTGWKTYTNPKYFYSLKYPPDWEVKTILANPDPGAIRISNINIRANQKIDLPEADVDIIVELNLSRKLPTQEWYLDREKNMPIVPINTKHIFITTIFRECPALRVDNDSLFFSKDEYMYHISWYVSGNYNQEFKNTSEKIFNQILSTFTFLDQNQPIPTTQSLDTSNWKTYTNSEYKFTLKYPPEWIGTEVNTEEVRFFKNLYLNNQSGTKTYISVTVKTNPNNQNLKEWLIAQNLISANYSEDFHTQIDETTIANIKGLKITTPVNGGQETYYLPMNRNVIQITYIFKGQSLAEYNELVNIFNQILSTFKFTNP